MANDDFIKALDKLDQMFLPVQTPWFLIGTSSLMLSGYDVTPNDIDIVTDKKTAQAIAQLLQHYTSPVQLKANEKFRSFFNRYVIAGVIVEVMGDLQVNTTNGWIDILPLIRHPEQINLNGKLFSVPSKTEQLQIYTLFNRTKDEAVLTLLRNS